MMEATVNIFSGSEILSIKVKSILEENNIVYFERNDIQSGLGAGFGVADQAVHIFVAPEQEELARKLLSAFEEK